MKFWYFWSATVGANGIVGRQTCSRNVGLLKITKVHQPCRRCLLNHHQQPFLDGGFLFLLVYCGVQTPIFFIVHTSTKMRFVWKWGTPCHPVIFPCPTSKITMQRWQNGISDTQISYSRLCIKTWTYLRPSFIPYYPIIESNCIFDPHMVLILLGIWIPNFSSPQFWPRSLPCLTARFLHPWLLPSSAAGTRGQGKDRAGARQSWILRRRVGWFGMKEWVASQQKDI